MKEPIAIIGIGCRFPGADGAEAFWKLLHDGVDAITPMPGERRQLPPFNQPTNPKSEDLDTSWGGFLQGIEQFDANFFGVSAKDAVEIDPQQRVLLEVSWSALEDASQNPEKLEGSQTGVFIGITGNGYNSLLSKEQGQGSHTSLNTSNAIAANRISHYFNWHGPSLAINTTCSSSLVAVALACRSLDDGESSLALAGGVNIFATLGASSDISALISPTNRCRSFAATADGYVRSEGVGIVVLKPLSVALANGDRVYAVIRGSAVNHNGRGNGLTTPNLQAQEALLRSAYQQAGVLPKSVHYLEAHSTGTLMGDALEIKALNRFFENDTPTGHKCHVGTVKTNIGHTEIASGIAGLIKVALAMHHRQIPPHLHFEKPNPYIEFEKSSLQVATILTQLPQDGVLNAGVSSFGIGGTNAHVVLESVPPASKNTPLEIVNASFNLDSHVLILSAKTESALRQMVIDYQRFLMSHPDIEIASICFTATRRSQFNYRLAILADSAASLGENLREYIDDLNYVYNKPSVFSGKVDRKKYQKQSLQAILLTPEQEKIIGEFNQNYPHYTLEQIIFGLPSPLELSPAQVQSLRHSILELWVTGVSVDWASLYSDSYPKIISLPSYPFTPLSFWFSALDTPSLNGKIDPQNQSPQEPEVTFLASRDELESTLTKIWEVVLETQPIGVRDNFFELGGYSLLAVRLITQIEKSLNRQLPLTLVFQAPTIEQFAHQLRSQESSAPKSLVIKIKPTGCKPPIYLINALGTGMFAYNNLARHLDAEQPVYGIEALGLDGTEMPHTQVEDMAVAYIQAIRTIQPHGAYYLGGLSAGGMIAFEIAQQFLTQGQQVAFLGLIDSYSPYILRHLLRVKNNLSDPSKRWRYLYSKYLVYRHKLLQVKSLAIFLRDPQFGKAEKKTYILQIKDKIWQSLELWVYRFFPLSKPPFILRQSLVLNAGSKAVRNYAPQQVYPGKLTLFRAQENHCSDYYLGWKELVADGVEVHEVPGNHSTLFTEPNIRVLAKKISDCLVDARKTMVK